MDTKQLTKEIGAIRDSMNFDSIENSARRELIAAYFRMFYKTNDAIVAIGKILSEKGEDYLADYFKNCIDFSLAEPDEDFLSALSYYRYSCIPEKKAESLLQTFSSHPSDDPLAFFYELVQNVDDCKYEDGKTPSFDVELKDGIIILHHNEIGMTPSDIFAICSAGESKKDPSAIGEKGIGFKTVFAPCEKVDVVSGKYCFSLINGGFHIAPFVPEKDYGNGTTMILHIKKESEYYNAETLYNDLLVNYGIGGYKNAMFSKCPVMYTQHLRCITVRCGDKSFSVSKSDQICDAQAGTVSFTVHTSNTGEEDKSITCFGIYRDVEMDEGDIRSRYEYGEVKGYPKQRIEIIAALDEEVSQGNMYSFLPCDQPITAPLCVHLPVKLNLNRTRMFFIGDIDTSATNNGETFDASSPATILWNEKLIGQFVGMLPDFYKALRGKDSLYRYIPDISNGEFFAQTANYMNTYCNNLGLKGMLTSIPYFKVMGSGEYCSAQEAVLFDEFISNKLNAACAWAKILKLTDKKPVEYNEEIKVYGRRVGLCEFDYGDSDMTEQFNELMKEIPGSQVLVLSALFNEKNKYLVYNNYAILKHVNQQKLRLYRANLTGGEEYLTCEGDWFVSNTLKSRKDCFFHFIKYKSEGLRLVPEEEIDEVNNLLELFKGQSSFSEEKLLQLCEFLYDCEHTDSSEDIGVVLSYCEKFLSNDTHEAETFALIIRNSNAPKNWTLRIEAEKRLNFNPEDFNDRTPITRGNFSEYEDRLTKLCNQVKLYIQHNIVKNDINATNSNIPAYELLQNADDSKRRNRTDGDGIGRDFEVCQDAEKIILRYSEAGFSLWDFFCIVSKGNSANQGTNTNTGKFGSGFKSIYTICSKVEIISHGVKCVLEPTDSLRQKEFPVPEFDVLENDNCKTEITLFFESEVKAENFFKKLLAPENYVFLKDIVYPEEKYPFSRDNEENKGNGFYYCPDTSDGEKPLFELYFPLPYERKMYPLYCGLPMESEQKLPFMLNVPKIHPTEDRKSISANDAYGRSNLNILSDVLSGIKAGFDAFAAAYPAIAYKYMPEDGIKFELAGTTLKTQGLKTYRIYPYKCAGDVIGCKSEEEIFNAFGSIKVFSETFYKCLGLKGVEEKKMNGTLDYIDHGIKEFLCQKKDIDIKGFTKCFTILDTIFGNAEPLLEDAKFINGCLPFLREELYSCDDDLYKYIIEFNGPATLAKFNNEDSAVDYFRSGRVAFKTINDYCVCNKPDDKYYYISISRNDEDLVTCYHNKKMPCFDRVIIDDTLNSNLIGPDKYINDLRDLLEDEDMTKEFFRDEYQTLIEFALDCMEVNSCGDIVIWLCDIIEESSEPDNYYGLLKFILCRDEDEKKVKANIQDFVMMLTEKEKLSPNYYGILNDLLSDSDVAQDCMESLIALIPNGGGEYYDWLIGIVMKIDFGKDSAENAKNALINLLERQRPAAPTIYFSLLEIITKNQSYIWWTSLFTLLELTELSLNGEISEEYADSSINLLNLYVLFETDFLEKLVGIYSRSKDDRIYSLFEKGLRSDNAKNITTEIVGALVALIEKSPEQQKYYEALKTAVAKCDANTLELDGLILTSRDGFKTWLAVREHHQIIFGFDNDSIGKLVRLSTTKNNDLYRNFRNAIGKRGIDRNSVKYDIFEGDEVGGTPVYFLENNDLPENRCFINGKLNNRDILIVIHRQGQQISALRDFLKQYCDIEFMTCDKYAQMKSKPSKGDVFSGDKLWESSKLSDELIRAAKMSADDLLDKDDAEIKTALVSTFKCDGFEFSGYGTEQKCPICGANLFAEASVLEVRWVSVDERKVPVLMCRNCCDFVDAYTYDVQFKPARKKNEIKLIFSLDGDKPKPVIIRMTFLQKMIMQDIDP